MRGESEVAMDRHLKKVSAHHDAWANTYDVDIARMSLYNRITLDNIRRFVPDEPGARILDAGGGTGIWSVELAKMGYHIILTDISEGMLAKAREKVSSLGLGHLVEITNSNILEMPEFDVNSFAMVLVEGDPLSYCGDHKQAMREMIRVLRPGGTLIASVDNRASGLNWLADADAGTIEQYLETGDVIIPTNLPEDQRYRCHTFTPSELRELFESHGLTVERIIGKPVLRGLAIARSDDSAVQERLYQLELKYCDDPNYLGLGGHLEIAGRKR